jgi:hypothetical protein
MSPGRLISEAKILAACAAKKKGSSPNSGTIVQPIVPTVS